MPGGVYKQKIIRTSVLGPILILWLLLWPGCGWALELTTAERDYLEQNRRLTVCVDPDWEPYEKIDGDGQYVGIAADLLRLMAQRLGIALTVLPTKNWDESLELSRRGRCDIVAFLNQTEQRSEWLLFTAAYFVDANVFITRKEHAYIADPARLVGESIVVPAGTSVEEYVRKNYPELRVVTVASESEALQLVEKGAVDMTLRSLTMAAYTINKEGWFNLKIAGEIAGFDNHFRIGVTNGNQLLRTILDKVIRSLEAEQVQAIVNRHVPITLSYRVDYALVFKIAAGALVVAFAGGCWVWQLRSMSRKQSALSERLRNELSQRRQVEEALRNSEERYRLLVEMAQEGILVVQNGRLSYLNPRVATITGYTCAELEGKPALQLVHREDRATAADKMMRRAAGEIVESRYPLRIVHKDGSTLWIEISGTCFEWNGQPATLNVLSDITARVRNEELITHMAQHDALTNLPNRRLFLDRLTQVLNLVQREKGRCAVIFIDLDQFKPVNDTYGHEVGDLLLQAVAARIQQLLRKSDTLARIGGDEFVVLLSRIRAGDAAHDVAEKIWQALLEPFVLAQHQVAITASLGIAVFPEHGASEVELLRHSDAAMYRAKRSGHGGVVMFSSGLS